MDLSPGSSTTPVTLPPGEMFFLATQDSSMRRFASPESGGYHRSSMPLGRLRRILPVFFSIVLFIIFAAPLRGAGGAGIFPLKDVKGGINGEVYTIFEGDTIEKVDLVVLGV